MSIWLAPDQPTGAMAEHSGQDCQQGEEEAGPGGDVGLQEVVDVDPSLGGQHQV